MSTFSSILKLEVQHSYYSDGRCRDLEFTPSPETEALLKGHRLRVKYRPTGLEIFAPLAGTDLLIPIAAGTMFRWFMRPRSTLFQAITAWPKKNGKGPLKISNRAATVEKPKPIIKYGGLSAAGVSEVVGFGQGYHTGNISLKKTQNGADEYVVALDKNGVPYQDIILDPTPARKVRLSEDFAFEQVGSFDPTAHPDRWALREGTTLRYTGTVPEEDTEVQISYPVSVPGGRGQLAYIDLYLEDEVVTSPVVPLLYSLSFKAKEEHWLYLVVRKNGGDLTPVGTSWQIVSSNAELPLPVDVLELKSKKKPSDLTTSEDDSSDANGNVLVADQAWEKLFPSLASNETAFFIRTQESSPYQENTTIQFQRKVAESEEAETSGPTLESNLDESYFLPSPDPLNHGLSFVKDPQKK